MLPEGPDPPPRDTTALWLKWIAISEWLADPDMELTCEEFCGVAEIFHQLRRCGAQFDPVFIGLLACLARQLVNTAADSDQDAHDLLLDIDDSDDDKGTRPRWRHNPTSWPASVALEPAPVKWTHVDTGRVVEVPPIWQAKAAAANGEAAARRNREGR